MAFGFFMVALSAITILFHGAITMSFHGMNWCEGARQFIRNGTPWVLPGASLINVLIALDLMRHNPQEASGLMGACGYAAAVGVGVIFFWLVARFATSPNAETIPVFVYEHRGE